MIATAAPVSQELIWGQVIARAWIDEDFKRRLMFDPRGVLAEHGVELPENTEINVVEDSPDVRNIVLPMPPEEDFIEEELVEHNAAWCYSGHCGRCGCGCGRCY
jgi:hypothetical protein